ncbi:MAG: 50S ribosomal protein L29 [Woeseia sp.]
MKAGDLKSKSIAELNEELLALRKEQFNLRMQQATGQLSRPHEHKRARKKIARVKTVIHELEQLQQDQAGGSK